VGPNSETKERKAWGKSMTARTNEPTIEVGSKTMALRAECALICEGPIKRFGWANGEWLCECEVGR